MKIVHSLSACVFLPILLFFISCKKPQPEPIVYIDNSKVSYEITGNYSGKFTVIHTKPDGFRRKLSQQILPWRTSVNANSEVTVVYFKAFTALGDTPGRSGEKAKAQLYIGGELHSSFEATADAKGMITLDSLWYNY